MTHEEWQALEAAADRPAKYPCWRRLYPQPDAKVRAGDTARGLWRLHDAHQALVAECAEQRRRRLVTVDPLDAQALRRAAEHVEAATLDLDAALVPDSERDEDHIYRARVVSLLDAATPGASDLYLRAIEDAADCLAEADRLANAKPPSTTARPARTGPSTS
jgi:hypothetical protein